jgi:hypothetical protein
VGTVFELDEDASDRKLGDQSQATLAMT